MQSRRQPRKEKRQSRVFLKSKKGYLLEGWICSTIEAVRTAERERERGGWLFAIVVVVATQRASNQAESGGLKNDEPEQNGFRRLASGLYARDFNEIGRAYMLCWMNPVDESSWRYINACLALFSSFRNVCACYDVKCSVCSIVVGKWVKSVKLRAYNQGNNI